MQFSRRLTTAAVTGIATLALAACSTTVTPTARPSGSASGTPGSTLAPVTAPPGNAASLQDAFVSVVTKVKPSVVQIETDQGLGSGIIYDSAGHIVTNAHVVDGASTFKVTLASGKVYAGTLVSAFPPDDLAVIKISASNLVPATFADSSTLRVGDIVMAIGNPLGFSSSVTEGIVSAIGRNVSEQNGYTLPNTIQTSAAINPGNSGGALVDLNGDVVGIPTLAVSDPQLGGAAAGIGFAIPSTVVTDIADQIIKNGHVVNSHRAYIGVSLYDTIDGVVIRQVKPGGPADKAGMVIGDQITQFNGQPVDSVSKLTEILAGLSPGQQVPVRITHQDGSTETVTVTLGEIPTS